MGKIISLVNQKGGVGKTTTAINLAQYLCEEGRLVLLADFDPQANATSGVGIDKGKLKGSSYDVIVRRRMVGDVIEKTSSVGYDILPSSSDLSAAALELAGAQNREYWLYHAVKQIKNNYDYIIIDSPPSLDLLTVNILAASDEVLIPVQTEYYALEGLSKLLETISLVRRALQPNLGIMGAVLTMYDKRNRLSRQVVKEVQDNFPGRVFETVIPRNVRLSEAPSFGKTILNFDRFSKGARAYRNLAKEVIDLEQKNKFSI